MKNSYRNHDNEFDDEFVSRKSKPSQRVPMDKMDKRKVFDDNSVVTPHQSSAMRNDPRASPFDSGMRMRPAGY